MNLSWRDTICMLNSEWNLIFSSLSHSYRQKYPNWILPLFFSSESSAATTASRPASTYGITSPISLAEAKPIDIELSQKLEESMIPHGVFESEEELAKR